jgi:hypothetical protein
MDLGDEPIGGLHFGDGSQLQLLHQPVLERGEHALRAPAGLRRIGRNVLDAEAIERPAHLGQPGLVDLAAGLGREEVVAAAVGVEAGRQALGREGLKQPLEARRRALLLHQEA